MAYRAQWWEPRIRIFEYNQDGTLAVTTGVANLPVSWGSGSGVGKLIGAYAVVNTAPQGASVILDLAVNGTSVYTTTSNRPTITSTQKASQFPMPAPDVTGLNAGDIITINILNIGSLSTEGSDLTVSLHIQDLS